MAVGRNVSFVGNWSQYGPERDRITTAMQRWNNYWVERGEPVEFDPIADNVTGADITIEIRNTLSNPNWDAETVMYGQGFADMYFTEEQLLEDDLFAVAMHELGHVVGFDDQTGCPSSVMNDPPSDHITCGDMQRLNGTYRGDQSPILIDLDGNGFECSSVPNGVLFDIKAIGSSVQVAWPTSSGDAFLVRDLNHNGVVDDSSEMFGNHTVLPTGLRATDGYAALAALDEDQDGDVDGEDPGFADLLLWRDFQRNGVTEPGELQLLTESVVVRIYTSYSYLNFVDFWGNWYPFWSTAQASGTNGTLMSVDVFLKTVQP